MHTSDVNICKNNSKYAKSCLRNFLPLKKFKDYKDIYMKLKEKTIKL